jgi:hypothetical protein
MAISFIMIIALGLLLIGAVVLVVVVALATGRRPNLINCPECGGGVSPHAETCSHCGRTMKRGDARHT